QALLSAAARTARPAPGAAVRLALRREGRASAVAGVDVGRPGQLLDGGRIDRAAIRLSIRRWPGSELRRRGLVGAQPQTVEVVQERKLVLGPAALPVVILDAEQDAAAEASGKAPDVDRVGEVAEVEAAGRGRREAGRQAAGHALGGSGASSASRWSPSRSAASSARADAIRRL